MQAAELRAEGAVAASQHCLERVLEIEPTLAAGQFAMGQNHAALREWPLAEQAFVAAADLHQVSRYNLLSLLVALQLCVTMTISGRSLTSFCMLGALSRCKADLSG